MSNYSELLKKFYSKVSIVDGGAKPKTSSVCKHLFGVAWNYALFEFTITDYFELTLFNKSLGERAQNLSYKKARKFAEIADDCEKLKRYESKTTVYKELANYITREQLMSDNCTFQDFCSFFKKHGKGVYKPDALDCGRGIEVWDSEKEDTQTMYKRFMKSSSIIDQLIIQHKKMQELCPKSVNTVRIFTLRNKDEIIVIGAALRMGNGTSVVDNYSAGGLVGAIDLVTGRIVASAEDATGKRYEAHPYSGVKIVGFEIPKWKQVIAFTKECAKEFTLNYAAWDIAIQDDGCALVEVNPNGMTNTIQIAGAGGRKKQYDCLLKQIR